MAMPGLNSLGRETYLRGGDVIHVASPTHLMADEIGDGRGDCRAVRETPVEQIPRYQTRQMMAKSQLPLCVLL